MRMSEQGLLAYYSQLHQIHTHILFTLASIHNALFSHSPSLSVNAPYRLAAFLGKAEIAILEHYEATGFVETWGFRFSKHLIYKEDAENPEKCKV